MRLRFEKKAKSLPDPRMMQNAEDATMQPMHMSRVRRWAVIRFSTGALAMLALLSTHCGEDRAQPGAATAGEVTGANTGAGGTTPTSGSPTAGSGGGGASMPGSGGGEAPRREDVTCATSDGLLLTGYLTTSASSPEGAPGVVLVHQFQLDDEQWGDLPEVLAAAGYRTLAFNLRGHGDSDAYDRPLADLLTDPAAAPRDVQAALDALGGALGADATRLAVVGTSVGANLAVVSSLQRGARTIVALSSRLPPIEALAAQPATGMVSAFYLAGELDPGGQAADALTLFDRTATPRQLEVVAGSADHGIELLREHPEVRDAVLAWLGSTL